MNLIPAGIPVSTAAFEDSSSLAVFELMKVLGEPESAIHLDSYLLPTLIGSRSAGTAASLLAMMLHCDVLYQLSMTALAV